MKKFSLITLVLAIAVISIGATQLPRKLEEQKIWDDYYNKLEEQLKWKDGFTKTKGEVYVPESFKAAYDALVKMNIEFKTSGTPEDWYYKEEDLLSFIAQYSTNPPQGYIPNTMLSPVQRVACFTNRYNDIIFTPNKTGLDLKKGKTQLTKEQFNFLLEEMKTFKGSVKDTTKLHLDQIDVLEVDCLIEQLPSYINYFTIRSIPFEATLPLFNTDNAAKTIRFSGTWDPEEFFYIFEQNNIITKRSRDNRLSDDTSSFREDAIERFAFLFFVHESIPDNPADLLSASTTIYLPKLVIFNLNH